MIKYTIVILFLVLVQLVNAQKEAEKGVELFKAGNYKKALAIFEEMLAQYPKDPDYNYYAGRCLLELNAEPEKCRKYLFNAATSIGQDDALYYYARINHQTYHFQEASRSLQQFNKQLNFLKRMNYDVKSLEEQIKTALNLTKQYTYLMVGEPVFLKEEELKANYNSAETGYSLHFPSYKEFIEYDLYPLEGSLLITAEHEEKRKFVIAEKKVTGSADIYELLYEAEFNGTVAVALPAIVNSKEEERFVWWDEDSGNLYFSSKGHENMGGFDIFRSTYDESANQWSKPENLGFPINSVHDDFLLPGRESSGWFLVTNRNVKTDELEIMEISIRSDHAIETKSGSPGQLQQLAAFRFNSIGTDNVAGIGEDSGLSGEIKYPKEKERKTLPEANIEKQYNAIIDQALELQLKADSLFRLADEKKQLLKSTNEPLTRKKLGEQVEKLTSGGFEIQAQADMLFKKAREIEESDFAVKSRIESDESSKDTRLTAALIRDRLSGNKDVNNSTNIEILNQFEIRTYSPYSENNPIPMDYKMPEGVLYRIQLGVFSQEIPMDKFGGMTPVTGEVIQQNGYKKFYAGLFSRIEDAEKALYQVKGLGYKDAYIVAWFNGKKVSINRAEEIEKTLH